MFFNSFLSLFDNKDSYKIVPCKFFCRFFHSHTIISRKKYKKVTLYSNIFHLMGIVINTKGDNPL